MITYKNETAESVEMSATEYNAFHGLDGYTDAGTHTKADGGDLFESLRGLKRSVNGFWNDDKEYLVIINDQNEYCSATVYYK